MTQENQDDVRTLIAQTEAGDLEWVYVEEPRGFLLANGSQGRIHLFFTPVGMMMGVIRRNDGYLTPTMYGDVLHRDDLELLLQLSRAIMSSFSRRIEIEVRQQAPALSRAV